MFAQITKTESSQIEVSINGVIHHISPGVSVAGALLMLSPFARITATSGRLRGPYCMMGVCFECLVTIDGIPNRRACMATVKQGMCIETQCNLVTVDESFEKTL